MIRVVMFIFSLTLAACQTTRVSPGKHIRVLVERGDTLNEIAKKYATNWKHVAQLNAIKSPYHIYPGQILKIKPGRTWNRPEAPALDFNKPFTKDLEGIDTHSGELSFFGHRRDRLDWPVLGRISSYFGEKRRRSIHRGVDIVAPLGTQVKSAADGVVQYSGRMRGFGRVVIVEHRFYKTLYAHLHRVYAKKGEFLRRGQKLGTIGRSGNATGVHLHFETRKLNGKKSIDPLEILRPLRLTDVFSSRGLFAILDDPFKRSANFLTLVGDASNMGPIIEVPSTVVKKGFDQYGTLGRDSKVFSL